MLRHTLRVDGEIARGLAKMSQAERREWIREAVLDHLGFASWAILATKHIEANPSAGFLAARWLYTAYMALVSSGGRYGYPARQDLEAPAAMIFRALSASERLAAEAAGALRSVGLLARG